MIVRNKEIYLNWKKINVGNGYGFDIFDFCEKWANLMEEEIEKGKSIEDVADKTSEIVGRKEISNTMFDSALNILYKCWIHGYDLESWFKKKNRHVIGGEKI